MFTKGSDYLCNGGSRSKDALYLKKACENLKVLKSKILNIINISIIIIIIQHFF